MTTVSLAQTAFPPLAVGFFGLAVGYLIYGPQELLGIPPRTRAVDITTGLWGIWMPGFMQFLCGTYLFVGIVWLHSITAAPLFMAALAFTAYGVHWFALAGGRALGGDPRPNAFMSIAFIVISVLGLVVFAVPASRDVPVALLFVGLTAVYVADFFASLFAVNGSLLGVVGNRALGFFHIVTGLWLLYLTWAVALNFASGFKLWV
jgi:hypothetical protein